MKMTPSDLEWILSSNGDDRIISWIRQRPSGRATVREVLHNHRHLFSKADDVESRLEFLQYLGVGDWIVRDTGPRGGRPTRAFAPKPSNRITPQRKS